MATTTSRGRSIIVPDFTSWKAADALTELSDLGLIGQPVLEPVDDVAEAGFVIGQEPVPGQPCRKSTFVLLTVGSHPDFDPRGFADGAASPAPVQPSLYSPHTAPGFRGDDDSADLDEGPSPTRETPSFSDAPAERTPAPEIDLPFGDEPAWAGEAGSYAPSAEDEAALYEQDVPLPGDQDDGYQAGAEWARLRREQESEMGWGDEREGDTQFGDAQAAGQAFFESAEVADGEIADPEPAVAPKVPRVRRRRYRRLTRRQKVTAFVVLGALVFVLLLATGSPKPRAAANAGTTTVATTPHTPAPSHVRKGTTPKVTPTRTVTVTVTTPTKRPVRRHKRTHHKNVAVTKKPVLASTPTTATATHYPAYTPPAVTSSTPPSSTPSNTPSSTPSSTATHAPSTTSSKSSSADRSAAHSSGTGSGGVLQSPTGAIAPPSPTQP